MLIDLTSQVPQISVATGAFVGPRGQPRPRKPRGQGLCGGRLHCAHFLGERDHTESPVGRAPSFRLQGRCGAPLKPTLNAVERVPGLSVPIMVGERRKEGCVPLREPARYIHERAMKAKKDGLTEAQFFDQWDERVTLWTEGRNDSILEALAEIHREHAWPW